MDGGLKGGDNRSSGWGERESDIAGGNAEGAERDGAAAGDEQYEYELVGVVVHSGTAFAVRTPQPLLSHSAQRRRASIAPRGAAAHADGILPGTPMHRMRL